MEFSSNDESVTIALEKIKILGAGLELPAKKPFTTKMGQMG